MKNLLKEGLAKIEEMGELEGVILMVCDDEGQFNLLKGKCAKMLDHLALESGEVMEIMERVVKSVKIQKKMDELLALAKSEGVISETEAKELESE